MLRPEELSRVKNGAPSNCDIQGWASLVARYTIALPTLYFQ